MNLHNLLAYTLFLAIVTLFVTPLGRYLEKFFPRDARRLIAGVYR